MPENPVYNNYDRRFFSEGCSFKPVARSQTIKGNFSERVSGKTKKATGENSKENGRLRDGLYYQP